MRSRIPAIGLSLILLGLQASPLRADMVAVVQGFNQVNIGQEDRFYFYSTVSRSFITNFGAGPFQNGISDIAFSPGQFAAIDLRTGGTDVWTYDIGTGVGTAQGSTGTSRLDVLSGLPTGDFLQGGRGVTSMVKIVVGGPDLSVPNFGTDQYDLTALNNGKVALIDVGPGVASNRNLRVIQADFTSISPTGPAIPLTSIDAFGNSIAGLDPTNSLVHLFDQTAAELSSFPIRPGTPVDLAYSPAGISVLYADTDEFLIYNAGGSLIDTVPLPFDVMPGDRIAAAVPEPSSTMLVGVGILSWVGYRLLRRSRGRVSECQPQ